MTPQEIVSELDRHIVGQHAAKRAVAIALRNRWRRQQVEPGLRAEITPKNILMIGPTGVGKTEIARRLARLADAPFIKVEATKFTEVGYVGKDVDTIIRDLMEVAVKEERERQMRRKRALAEDAAEERVLDILVPPPRDVRPAVASAEPTSPDNTARQVMRKRLREGLLDDKEIEIDVAEVTELWRRGSVVSSWLLDLTAEAFHADPELSAYAGVVSDSGEGRWTINAAIDEGVPVPVLSAALFQRFSSRGRSDVADQVLSAMRAGFGGHIERKDTTR